jgi:outer membrane receptor protein involved in Fe transport
MAFQGREATGRRGFRTLSLLLAGMFAAASSTFVEPGAAQERPALVGTVLAADGGAPVSGALVTAVEAGIRGMSGADGQFSLFDLAAGTHTLVVERIGFATTRVTVRISDAATAPLDVEIRLPVSPVLVSGIVVTASGEAQRRVETPASVGRLEGEVIRDVRPTHPAELMNRLPGIWVSPTTGEGHMTAIRQPITTNPVYLFLEDGVPTRSPGFFNHNALYEVNVPQSDRIEVIRGPGTALYGSDAIGGVIDVGTRAPSPAPTFDANVEGNDLGYRRLLVTGSTTSQEHGLRADLNVTVGDEWRDFGDYDRQAATLRWDWALSQATHLQTTATYSNVHQSDPSVLNRADLEENPRKNTHPITYRDVQAFRLKSQLEHRSGNALLQVTPFVRWNSLDLMPSWLLSFDPVIFNSGHSSLGVLARYHRDLDFRTRLTVGLDVDRSPGRRQEDRITVVRENGIAVDWTRQERIYDYTATYTGVSPYLQLQLRPLRYLHVTGGLRYDATSFDYETKLEPTQTGRHKRPENTKVSHANLGPSLGAALTFSDEVNLFAGFREAFRSPSEGQLFRQGTAVNTVSLKPVEARSFEAGVRGEMTGRLSYEVSAYRMDVRNDILSYVRPEDGLTESVNAGRTRHQGVEVGATVQLFAGLQADLSASRASHKYVEWSPRSTVSYAGNHMVQAPRDLVSARLRSPIPILDRGSVELEWLHMGEFWLDPENTHTYDGHDLWNVRLDVPLARGIAFSARVMNLTDERYAERGSYNAFRGEELSPGKPRTVQAGFRYRWGR